MDPLFKKAQGQMSRSVSRSTSKSSSRKARGKKKRTGGKTQNAGQPTGPSSSGRSRSALMREEEDVDVEVASASSTPTRRGNPRSKGGGEGTDIATYTVGALHAIDIGLGLSLLIYGCMVHVGSVTAAAVCYGLVLLVGALAGAIGYYTGECNRRGIFASSIAGALLCLLDIGAFIAVFAGWEGFIKFLDDNHEALMLSESSVSTIDGLKILFALIFIFLAGFEGYRAMHMFSIKDSESKVSPLSRSKSSSKLDTFLSWFGLAKRKKTDDFVVFDDNLSMESSLLWSKDGAQPTSDDYLEFVPEHERGLANFTAKVSLPPPPEDKVDY